VRRVVHDAPGERDGVDDGGEAGDGAAAQGGALHDAGLHLDGAVGGEHGAAAGVEVRAVLQLLHLRKDHFFFCMKRKTRGSRGESETTCYELDDVERGAPVAERGGADVEAAAERGEAAVPELRRQRARDVPGAAVQRQRPPHWIGWIDLDRRPGQAYAHTHGVGLFHLLVQTPLLSAPASPVSPRRTRKATN
jgi:hypothetical protein